MDQAVEMISVNVIRYFVREGLGNRAAKIAFETEHDFSSTYRRDEVDGRGFFNCELNRFNWQLKKKARIGQISSCCQKKESGCGGSEDLFRKPDQDPADLEMFSEKGIRMWRICRSFQETRP